MPGEGPEREVWRLGKPSSNFTSCALVILHVASLTMGITKQRGGIGRKAYANLYTSVMKRVRHVFIG